MAEDMKAFTEVTGESTRPFRNCVGCGQSDYGPRDQVALRGGESAYWHFDCHVLVAGCEVCRAVLAAAGTGEGPKGLKNEKLLEKLHSPEVAKAEIMTSDSARTVARKESN